MVNLKRQVLSPEVRAGAQPDPPHSSFSRWDMLDMGLSPPTTVVGRARPEEDDVVVASGKLLKQGRGRTTGLSKCFWQERDFVLSSSRAEGRQRRRPSLTYYKGGKEKGRVLLDSTPGRDPSRASGEGQRYEFALKGVDERGLPCELRLAARSGAVPVELSAKNFSNLCWRPLSF